MSLVDVNKFILHVKSHECVILLYFLNIIILQLTKTTFTQVFKEGQLLYNCFIFWRRQTCTCTELSTVSILILESYSVEPQHLDSFVPMSSRPDKWNVRIGLSVCDYFLLSLILISCILLNLIRISINNPTLFVHRDKYGSIKTTPFILISYVHVNVSSIQKQFLMTLNLMSERSNADVLWI